MGKRFLVSRLSALGDVVCTLPVASSLKAAFPDSHISWVVDPRFAGIVECCAAVDKVIRAKPGKSPSTWPKFDEPFDAALDMQGLFKSGVCTLNSRAKERVGYHWQREGSWLFTAKVLPDPSSLHVVDQYVDVARSLGGNSEAVFGLEPKAEDTASIASKLSEKGIDGEYVVMNPGAGWVSKRWPPESFAQLADRLDVPVVFIGGPAASDQAAMDEVKAHAKKEHVSLVGQTSVRELVALIQGCRAHVGGDTGSTHLASALGRPAIGLYSITNPVRSCPYGQIDRCHFESGGLANIRVEAVYKTVMEALA